MKAIAPHFKSLKYLFWLGPMLLVAGLSAGVVSGLWAGVPLVLLLLGLGIIAFWWLYQAKYGEVSQPGFWSRRSTQVSANALIATLSMLAILGLINFLGARHVARLDLTENQIFTLAPETQQLVSTLKQPVKVWVFTPQPNAQDRELLESYQRQGNRFSYEFVDPNSQPTLVQRLQVKSLGDVIAEVQPQGRKQFVQTVMPDNPDSLVKEGQRLSEVKLTSAIGQVVSDRKSQVYVLQGHGEAALQEGRGAMSQAVKTLGDRNAIVKPLNLAENREIPADANVVVVAGAKKPLLEQEVKALETFLQQGGNLLLLVDPNTDPGLDSLIKPWGVVLDPRVVIDASGAGKPVNLGPAVPVVTQYGEHPITKEFGNTSSFYPLSRPVDVDARPDVKSTPLLYTNAQSWAESDLKSQNLEFNPQSDRQGPLILGVALSRPVKAPTAPKSAPTNSPTSSTESVNIGAASGANPTPSPTTESVNIGAASSPAPSPSPATEPTNIGAASNPAPKAFPQPTASPTPAATGSPSPSPSASPKAGQADKQRESRLVVIGNSSFATDGLFNQLINGDVFLNSVNWLSQQDQPALSIRPKEPKNRRINLTGDQSSLVNWLALAILPLIGFVTALIVWWRRR